MATIWEKPGFSLMPSGRALGNPTSGAWEWRYLWYRCRREGFFSTSRLSRVYSQPGHFAG